MKKTKTRTKITPKSNRKDTKFIRLTPQVHAELDRARNQLSENRGTWMSFCEAIRELIKEHGGESK